jgi:peptide/nickel transport system substrate-binding protein
MFGTDTDSANEDELHATLTRDGFLRRGAGVAAGASLFGLAGEAAGRVATTTATPKRGGSIQIAVSDASTSERLDPAGILGANDALYLGAIYELLVTADDRWNLRPALAESWKVNADATQWTFNLRKGVKFHNGKPFTADDAVASIAHHLDKKTGSPGYARLSESIDPSGLRAAGPLTLVAKLKRPDSLFGLALAQRWVGMFPKETTKFDVGTAIGTGPFRLVSWTPGQSWEVKRNPSYWQQGLPYLDRIRGIVIPESSTKLQSVISGDSHLSDPIDYAQVSTARKSSAVQLFRMRDATEAYIVMDSSKPPFGDNRVRMAVKLATGRNLVVNTAYHGYGTATSDVPATPKDPFFPPKLGVRKQDFAQAKQLLAAAGYPNGIELELFASPITGGIMDMAVTFAESVKPAGINVKIQQWPVDTYWDQVWLAKPMFVSYLNHRHPSDRLALTFASTAPWQETKVKSKGIDDLLAQALATPDLKKQQRLFQQALLIVANEEGNVIPAYADRLFVAKKKLRGVESTWLQGVRLHKAYLT